MDDPFLYSSIRHWLENAVCTNNKKAYDVKTLRQQCP